MSRDEFFRVLGATFGEPFDELTDDEKQVVWRPLQRLNRVQTGRLVAPSAQHVMDARRMLQAHWRRHRLRGWFPGRPPGARMGTPRR